MKLDVLSLEVRAQRWGNENAKVGIAATVIPAEGDSIRLGSKHIFADYNFQSEFERIDAQLWISSDADLAKNVQVLLPDPFRKDKEPAGYASLAIPRQGSEAATLTFMLHVDEARLTELLTQFEGASAGSITIDVWIDGLKFGMPDEQIWELDADGARQYLPVGHFSVQVAKLRTTRLKIREARENIGNKELADSDDPEMRKLGVTWLKDVSKRAAEQSAEPSLTLLRQCRALLALLLICAVTAIFQRL